MRGRASISAGSTFTPCGSSVVPPEWNGRGSQKGGRVGADAVACDGMSGANSALESSSSSDVSNGIAASSDA